MAQLYVDPPDGVPDLSDCHFYHSIELPGLGLQVGEWDLRPGIEHYLGSVVDFAGKRVLEIGTANGFVCFELERRGAEVVAYDLPSGAVWDTFPLPGVAEHADDRRDMVEALHNAFWLAHRLLGSRARVAHGYANELPAELGDLDVVVIGNVLQHLHDPIGAVIEATRRAPEVVVTETDWMRGHYDDLPAMVYFAEKKPFSWYQVKAPLLEALLGDLGFEPTVEWHEQLFIADIDFEHRGEVVEFEGGAPVPHYTVTGRRR